MGVFNVKFKKGCGLLAVMSLAIIAFVSAPKVCSAQDAASAVTPSTVPAQNVQPTPPSAPAAQPPAATPTPPQASAPVEAPTLVGAETCLACHNTREDFKGNIHAGGFLHKKGINFTESCETCHGPGSAHAAAGGDRNNPGFATIKNFKGSAAQVNETCLKCHQDAAKSHWTGSVHEARGLSCISCHSVHEAKSDKRLLKQANTTATCYTCHQDIKAQMRRNSHMPIGEEKMTCTDCHDPHGTATAKNIKADSVPALCLSCHQDKRGPFLWEHPPVRENCLNCHTPHGSHNDKMLVEKLPLLCQRCHDGTRHPSTLYDNGKIQVLDTRIDNRGCVNCHSNIHGSNHPSGKVFLR